MLYFACTLAICIKGFREVVVADLALNNTPGVIADACVAVNTAFAACYIIAAPVANLPCLYWSATAI